MIVCSQNFWAGTSLKSQETFPNLNQASPHDMVSPLAAATGLEDLASQAARHALDLRSLTEKAARSRKKKALVDFLQALGQLGVSHHRSAIPAAERGIHSWFIQVKLTSSAPDVYLI